LLIQTSTFFNFEINSQGSEGQATGKGFKGSSVKGDTGLSTRCSRNKGNDGHRIQGMQESGFDSTRASNTIYVDEQDNESLILDILEV
jgi:hypothetical protein